MELRDQVYSVMFIIGYTYNCRVITVWDHYCYLLPQCEALHASRAGMSMATALFIRYSSY